MKTTMGTTFLAGIILSVWVFVHAQHPRMPGCHDVRIEGTDKLKLFDVVKGVEKMGQIRGRCTKAERVLDVEQIELQLENGGGGSQRVPLRVLMSNAYILNS